MRGGLREKQSGVWEVRIEAGRDPITGRRRQLSRTVRGTKQEAERVLNALVSDADAGLTTGTDATFRFLCEEWLALTGAELSPTTLRRYRGLLSKQIYPALGDRPVSSIRTNDLDRLYLGLVTTRGLAPATVRQVHAVIRRAFKQAVTWGWIANNPAANASPPRVPKPELSPPDVAQVAAFLERAKVDDPALGRILHVLASTGARRGELCALRWRDLDVDRQSLSIERSIIEVAGGLSEKDTKTHSSRRIALDPGTIAVFEQQRIDATRLAKLADADLTAESFIFSTEPGGETPLPPDSVTKRFQKLRDSLGLGRVRLHDLRHFTATRLIAAGVPIRTVSGRLGHANPSTTLAVYAHFVEASDQDAAAVMGDLLSPP